MLLRLKDFSKLHTVFDKLQARLSQEKNMMGKPIFDVQTWEKLSPFYNIARMIDMMTFFIKIMLVAVVLVSIMNVMIMAVYERIREIGTMAAIGTLPRKILSLFLVEGLLMGIIGSLIGGALSLIMIHGLNAAKITLRLRQAKGHCPLASVNPSDLLLISGIVVVVAVDASLQPALKASRMDPKSRPWGTFKKGELVMFINMLFKVVVLVMAILAAAPACALDGAQILEQVDHNLQPGDLEMYRKIINIEPDGSKKEYVLWFLKKDKDKVVTLFVSPASETGRATLRLGDNMWLFIPNVGKPVRITSLQSVVGGVFNNADIMRLDYSVEYNVTELSEDQGQHLLDLKAKSGAVAYDRLKMWVLKDKLVPTKIECYAATGMLIKTLHFKEVKDIGDGVTAPSVMETDSPSTRGTSPS